MNLFHGKPNDRKSSCSNCQLNKSSRRFLSTASGSDNITVMNSKTALDSISAVRESSTLHFEDFPQSTPHLPQPGHHYVELSSISNIFIESPVQYAIVAIYNLQFIDTIDNKLENIRKTVEYLRNINVYPNITSSDVANIIFVTRHISNHIEGSEALYKEISKIIGNSKIGSGDNSIILTTSEITAVLSAFKGLKILSHEQQGFLRVVIHLLRSSVDQTFLKRKNEFILTDELLNSIATFINALDRSYNIESSFVVTLLNLESRSLKIQSVSRVVGSLRNIDISNNIFYPLLTSVTNLVSIYKSTAKFDGNSLAVMISGLEYFTGLSNQESILLQEIVEMIHHTISSITEKLVISTDQLATICRGIKNLSFASSSSKVHDLKRSLLRYLLLLFMKHSTLAQTQSLTLTNRTNYYEDISPETISKLISCVENIPINCYLSLEESAFIEFIGKFIDHHRLNEPISGTHFHDIVKKMLRICSNKSEQYQEKEVFISAIIRKLTSKHNTKATITSKEVSGLEETMSSSEILTMYKFMYSIQTNSLLALKPSIRPKADDYIEYASKLRAFVDIISTKLECLIDKRLSLIHYNCDEICQLVCYVQMVDVKNPSQSALLRLATKLITLTTSSIRNQLKQDQSSLILSERYLTSKISEIIYSLRYRTMVSNAVEDAYIQSINEYIKTVYNNNSVRSMPLLKEEERSIKEDSSQILEALASLQLFSQVMCQLYETLLSILPIISLHQTNNINNLFDMLSRENFGNLIIVTRQYLQFKRSKNPINSETKVTHTENDQMIIDRYRRTQSKISIDIENALLWAIRLHLHHQLQSVETLNHDRETINEQLIQHTRNVVDYVDAVKYLRKTEVSDILEYCQIISALNGRTSDEMTIIDHLSALLRHTLSLVDLSSKGESIDSNILSPQLLGNDVSSPSIDDSIAYLARGESSYRRVNARDYINLLAYLQYTPSKNISLPNYQHYIRTLSLILRNHKIDFKLIDSEQYCLIFEGLSSLTGETIEEQRLLMSIYDVIHPQIEHINIPLDANQFTRIARSFSHLKGMKDHSNTACDQYLSLFVCQLSQKVNDLIGIEGKDLSSICHGLQYMTSQSMTQKQYLNVLIRIIHKNFLVRDQRYRILNVTSFRLVSKCVYGLRGILQSIYHHNLDNQSQSIQRNVTRDNDDSLYGNTTDSWTDVIGDNNDSYLERDVLLNIMTYIFSYYRVLHKNYQQQMSSNSDGYDDNETMNVNHSPIQSSSLINESISESFDRAKDVTSSQQWIEYSRYDDLYSYISRNITLQQLLKDVNERYEQSVTPSDSSTEISRSTNYSIFNKIPRESMRSNIQRSSYTLKKRYQGMKYQHEFDQISFLLVIHSLSNIRCHTRSEYNLISELSYWIKYQKIIYELSISELIMVFESIQYLSPINASQYGIGLERYLENIYERVSMNISDGTISGIKMFELTNKQVMKLLKIIANYDIESSIHRKFVDLMYCSIIQSNIQSRNQWSLNQDDVVIIIKIISQYHRFNDQVSESMIELLRMNDQACLIRNHDSIHDQIKHFLDHAHANKPTNQKLLQVLKNRYNYEYEPNQPNDDHSIPTKNISKHVNQS